MISILRGTLVEKGSRNVVIDTHGVGYKVNVTDDVLHTLKADHEITLWTHLAIREDSHELYGFPNKKDRDFFQLLITVSGIGPKSALNIMSLVSADTLTHAVRTGSVTHLVKVSGLGKKTAEKIVLELKDKLGTLDIHDTSTFTAGISSDIDALEALKALGYDADEAREALKKVAHASSSDTPHNKNHDTGLKVKAALKILGKV